MEELSRRQLMKQAAWAGLTATVLAQVQARAADEDAVGPLVFHGDKSLDSATIHWLEKVPSTSNYSATLGVPWPKGLVKGDQKLKVVGKDGSSIEAQSWPIAYWPDGTLKWSAHAFLPGDKPADQYQILQGEPDAPKTPIKVNQTNSTIEIDTGVITATVNQSGSSLIQSIKRDGKDIFLDGHLVAIVNDQPSDSSIHSTRREQFKSEIQSVKVEQSGPVRSVIKVDGVHVGESTRTLLPFSVRLYFHAGSDAIRLMHSFTYDANEYKDYISGIGMRFSVAMRDQIHDRHIRLVGQDHGLFAEGVRNITGLRRDPGREVKDAQLNGLPTPPTSSWPPATANRLNLIPAWGDYTLTQLNADGFQIKKRTKEGHGWIPCGAGKRSRGVGYIGSISGGVAFGLRDFWQRHPVQLDVRSAHTDKAEVTLWMYSPEAPAMDLRFYHDGMGMNDSYPMQREGLEITYEDYEPNYGTPFGISRTSEIHLRVLGATPSRQALVEFSDIVAKPPQLACDPKRYLDCRVFGGIWTIPDRSHPTKAMIEDWLDSQISQYIREVDQRSWYGFWDYGDVMHTYDTDRNVWRYDVGGFAWDNSELSPDLFFWYSFLRTGRADLFRFIEAMSRHTGEVDVYHIGRFKGLGTRHGVQHWADSSKQSRISTAIYRRIHYFLTADERVGDLLREQLKTIESEKKIVVGRKLGQNPQVIPLPPLEDPPRGGEVGLGGMGYCNAMAAWITEAERTNDPKLHAFIIKSMQGIGELPYAFFTTDWKMNIDTGEIRYYGGKGLDEGHLTAAFGMPEMCAELIVTYGEHAPKFEWAFAKYGELFTSSEQQKMEQLGVTFRPSQTLADSYARLKAFAAKYKGDKEMAQQAWKQFIGNRGTIQDRFRPLALKHLEGIAALNPIDAVPMGTNGTAQNGLAALQLLAYAGDSIP